MSKFILYFLIISSVFFNIANAEATDSSVCLLARDKGDTSCSDSSAGQRFYYHTGTKQCQPFFYFGCNGNLNRFESAQECKDNCSNVDDSHQPANTNDGRVIPVPLCDGGVRAGIDSSHRVLSCNECPKGYSCKNDLCCPSKEYTCSLEYDTGKYATTGSHIPRYFYSKTQKNCLLFTFYGALGNANNFQNYNDCVKFCGKK